MYDKEADFLWRKKDSGDSHNYTKVNDDSKTRLGTTYRKEEETGNMKE